MKIELRLSLKRFSQVVNLVLVLALCSFPAHAASISAQQRQLLDLVNAERAKAGLASLQWDDHLAQAARAHTEMMAERGQLSHQFSGESALPQRAGAAGAHFNSVAENVAYAGDVISLHRGLMHSPHHRANILNPESNAIGIGFAEKDGELYVTEDFARLLPSYSTSQFTQQVIAAFNRLRREGHISLMTVRPNSQLQQAACRAKLDPQKIIRGTPGATKLAVFTATQPTDLPSDMQRAAADRSLRRMDIGVCFKADDKAGFSKYWVVAAFYHAP